MFTRLMEGMSGDRTMRGCRPWLTRGLVVLGLCLAFPPSLCAQECTTPADCNDGNDCTEDICNAQQECENPPWPEGTPCGDPTYYSPCDGPDSCNGTGGCRSYPENGEPCDDGLYCNIGETCLFGDCQGGNTRSCGDGNPCTDDVCDETNDRCLNPNDDTNSCDDSNVCNGSETCVSGVCEPGTELVCDDEDVCTDDSCHSTHGCQFVNNTAPCSDSLACTVGDACSGGTCVGGNNPCPPPLICVEDPPGYTCESPPCESDEDCDDQMPCTVDVCLGTTPRVCAVDMTASHAACDNGVYCDGAEYCDAFRCVGGPDDGEPCANDLQCGGEGSCDPVGSGICQNPGEVVCPEGEFCSETHEQCVECELDDHCHDDDMCNGVETCDPVTHLCIPGTEVDCSHLDDPCHLGWCHPATGNCESQEYGDHTPCVSDDLCYPEHECINGECVGIVPDGCVDIRLSVPAAYESVEVGEVFEVDLYALANGCNPITGFCGDGVGQPISMVEINFSWDPDFLELVNPAVEGVANPEDACPVCSGSSENYYEPCEGDLDCPGGSCMGGPCDVYCETSWTRFDWAASSFPNDCRCQGGDLDQEPCYTDADCTPPTGSAGICGMGVNAPCDFPGNDGGAFWAAMVSTTGCGDDPWEPACAMPTPPGLLMTRFKFKALELTGPSGTELKIEHCIGQKKTTVVSASTAGDNLVGSLGDPAVVVVGACEPPTVVEAEGSRYIAVVPAAGTESVAFYVTGKDDVSCVEGHVEVGGRLGPVLENPPALLPEEWGAVHIYGEDLIGSETYEIRADCDPSDPGVNMSDPVEATLWRWGDVNHTGVVDFVDITMIVDGFRHAYGTPFPCAINEECFWFLGPFATCNTSMGLCESTVENLDIIGGSGCTPDGVVDFVDITTDVSAFLNLPDPCRGVCPR